MKKIREAFAILALSTVFLISGCTVNITTTGQPSAPSTQAMPSTQEMPGTQAEPGTESRSETTISDYTEAPQNDPSNQSVSVSMDVNGNAFSVADAVYCVSDNESVVIVTGEYSGAYAIMIFESLSKFNAGSSFSQNDFGNEMALEAALLEPSANLGYVGSSQSNIIDATFSVTSMSDSFMNVKMSGKITTDDGVLSFNMSGDVALAEVDRCRQILADINQIIQDIQNSSSSGGTPFRCPSCHGNGVCHYCKGDGTCHICLGIVDHCLSCNDSNICQYCQGTGVCKYCNGEGVMS